GSGGLRGRAVAAVPRGATAAFTLSTPVRAAVHGVSVRPGTVSRLYVDLPPGTRVRRDLVQGALPASPLAALRVGAGDGGVVRLVLELDGASTYRVARHGRTLTVAVAREAPAAPTESAPASSPPPPARPVERLARRKIVLDPGHGGQDPGAHGFAVEKDVTLAIAQQLATLLRTRLGAEVVLTRTRDATLPLPARTARANAEGA